MRRRFGSRRRRGQGEGRQGSIDRNAWFQRIAEDAAIPVGPLEAVEVEDLPASFAVVGRESAGQGEFNHVAFSPRSGGDALLAAIVAGFEAAGSKDFSGAVLALAPQWSAASRRRLSLVSQELPFRLRALEASSLQEVGTLVQGDPPMRPAVATLASIAAASSSPADRDLFLRAAQAFEGIAAKHDVVARGVEGALQLIVNARKMAELRVDTDGVALEVWLPQRSLVRLKQEDLAGALDGVEGQLRKRQNDRRVQNAEEGQRAKWIPLVAEAGGVVSFRSWPLAGDDPEVLDFVGIDAGGSPVVGVCRNALGMVEWGPVLDALLALRSGLPHHLAGLGDGLRYGMPRLVVASKEATDRARQVARGLALDIDFFGVRRRWGRGLQVVPVSPSGDDERREIEETAPESAPESAPEPDRAEASAAPDARNDEGAGGARPAQSTGGRSRRRRRGGRGRRSPGSSESEAASEAEAAPESGAEDSASEDAKVARFDEVSFFDLEDEPREGPSSGGGRRRRGGRGGRSGGRRDARGSGSSEGSRGRSVSDEDASSAAAEETTAGAERDAEETFDADAEIDERLSPLPDDMPDFETQNLPVYEDDEAKGDADDSETAPDVEEAPVRPRRRAALLVHADRASLLGAVVLARDIRLVEGIWVYPQEEIMTFFKSVATDLREETPIYVVGFTPSPAREVLQAATLYADRLIWFDHHDWPPEDREALARVIGEKNIDVRPGTGTCLPAILEGAVRRSRFSDKLVDLGAGRFTQHDYEKWGRLWWSRLGEFVGRPGDRRGDLEPLLAGRPSDLAKAAAKVPAPEPPAEVAYVAGRDFRLVHFATHSLVVVDTPEGLDPALAARIARERYGASLSLAMNEHVETLTLTGEELPGRRSLDVLGLVEHLGQKLPWVEVLSGEDRVARFRIDDLAREPQRLDEVIGRIATGRSILEH